MKNYTQLKINGLMLSPFVILFISQTEFNVLNAFVCLLVGVLLNFFVLIIYKINRLHEEITAGLKDISERIKALK